MAKKGPPPDAQKWLEEQRRGEHQGLTPTPAHEKSIWDTDYIPERYAPINKSAIEAEAHRLGVTFPQSVLEQLLIQNGGQLDECVEGLFENSNINWTNATVDGIETVESWERAEDCHWFDSAEDVPDKNLLVVIASHSESQLCLDFRVSGPNGVPGVSYIDVCTTPTQVAILTKTVDDFIRSIVAAR